MSHGSLRFALRLVHAPFAAGDIITRQGAIAHWLYVLESGDADVYVERALGLRHHVASLLGSSFFGEMGLLTGEPRRATVVARQRTGAGPRSSR